MGLDLFQILLFLIPPYVANAVPVVFGGGMPLDLGVKAWDGRRVLGDGKTIRGLLAGLAGGFAAGFVMAYVFNNTTYLTVALFSSTGAMFGDVIGSFIKRRMGMERGKESVIMDQLLFIICAIIFAHPFLSSTFPQILSLESIAFICLFTYIMHKTMNVVANRMGLKNVPW